MLGCGSSSREAPRALTSAACYRTHRAKGHSSPRGDREKHANSGVSARDRALASPLPSLDACWFGPHKEVRIAMLMEMVMETLMRRLRLARRLVPGVLGICVMSLGAPCAAQDSVDAPALPAAPDAADGRGSLFAPGGFIGLIVPVHDRIALNVYGFYYGEVKAPVAQVDLPIRATRFLTITPSYLYYEVPPAASTKPRSIRQGLPTRSRRTSFESMGH